MMDTEVIKLIITGIISPTIALYAKYIYDKKIKEFGVKSVPISELQISLTSHPFFERMKILKTHIQYSFELTNPGKQEVFKDILINKFAIVIEEYWQMIKEIESKKDTLSELELYNLLIDHIRNGLKLHEVYFRTSSYTIEEQKCLEIVMRKFNKWHSPRIESIFNSIQSVCTSKFYSGVVTKSSVALDVLQGAFVDIINDAELTLNEINGDLKGLTFKGIKL
jgi:hypothetical protein